MLTRNKSLSRTMAKQPLRPDGGRKRFISRESETDCLMNLSHIYHYAELEVGEYYSVNFTVNCKQDNIDSSWQPATYYSKFL